jgi:hypothetical protein
MERDLLGPGVRDDSGVPPVFVGGSARSGTTICGRLLGEHSRYFMIPVEANFHVRKGGFPDLLRGAVSLKRFVTLMRERWFVLSRVDRPRGIHRFASREQLESALQVFERRFEEDGLQACRELMTALFQPAAHAAGRGTWLEMSPPNISNAPLLAQIFPEARFVHMVRDGRDVACSLTRLQWAPRSLTERLDWWRRAVAASMEGAASLDRDRLLTVRLEELVGPDRERVYRSLRQFLDLEDESGMRRFFDTTVTAEKAHLGRWRQDVAPDEMAGFLARYEDIVRDLDPQFR